MQPVGICQSKWFVHISMASNYDEAGFTAACVDTSNPDSNPV